MDKDIIHDFSKDIVLSGQVTSFDKPVKNIEIDINGIKYKTDEKLIETLNKCTKIN